MKGHFDETRRLMDEKIVELSEALVKLKIQRNEFAPIAQLPPEILGTIFTVAVSSKFGEQLPYTMSSFKSVDFMVAFNFSYVSHKWRSLALNTPCLWGTLSFHDPKWARVMLKRSKMSNLTIETTFGARSTRPFLRSMNKVLIDHANRIRDIHFDEVSSAHFDTVLQNVTPASLQLRSVFLRCPHVVKEKFLDTLLAEPCGLRQLAATRCDFAWYSLPLAGLTHLEIRENPSRPSLSSFITALHAMPTLQVLVMENSLPDTSDGSHPQPVGLTRLVRLTLSSSKFFAEIATILRFIVVPTTANVTLGCKETSDLLEDAIAILASSLSAFISAMNPAGREGKLYYRRLYLSSSYTAVNTLQFLAWREDFVNLKPPALSLDVTAGSSKAAVLRKIFHSLPLTYLHRLDLCYPFGHNVLVDTIGKLVHVQHVEVSGISIIGLVRAMRTPDFNTLQAPVYTLAFPALQTLTISGTWFASDGIDVEALKSCLIKRGKHNGWLKKLEIFDCSDIDGSDVQSLRKYADDVKWDGDEMEEENDDVEEVEDK